MSNLHKSALWMIGAIISFTLMAIAGRAVSDTFSTFEIMLYRSAIGLVIVLSVAVYLKRLSEVTTRNMGLQLTRNIAHFIGQNCWFYALPLIPLAQLFALEFTSPIWVMLLATLFLGERMTLLKISVAVVGFAGVYIATTPDFSNPNIGIVAGAFAAIGFAISAIATRKLTQSETLVCILFYLTFMQMVFALCIAGFDGQITPLSWVSLPWILVISLCGLCAHLCLTISLSLAPASEVMPIDYARLPLIVAVGVFLYDENVDVWVITGAVLIILANYINLSKSRS